MVLVNAGDAQVTAFTIPGLRLVSLANQREHWSTRAKRTKKERHVVGKACMVARVPRRLPDGLKASVHIVRIGKRMMDEDNLGGACKAVQDAVAEWLGVDDGDRKRIVFTRGQEIGKTYGVRVAVNYTPAEQYGEV